VKVGRSLTCEQATRDLGNAAGPGAGDTVAHI
jgi:hypothetical protein